MPGVITTTTARSGPSTALVAASGTFFVAGFAERGPVDKATLVRGLADFESIFGGRVAYSILYDTIKTFFAEGGSQAYVVRVVGSSATGGTVTVNDNDSPANQTVRFAAANPGAWSGNLSIVVEDGSIADTSKVTILLNDVVVEVKNNLASPSDIVDAFATSLYVSVTDLGSAATSPLNLPLNGEYTPTTGDDDRSAVDANGWGDGLDLFSKNLGDGAVAIPGLGTAVHAVLVSHAEANNRIALLSHSNGATVDDLKTAAGDVDSAYAGLFAPWLTLADSAVSTRDISPEGYVAAKRAVAHNTVGAWRAPAGAIAISSTAAALTVEYTDAEASELDGARISVILKKPTGVRLYGWRSLSSDEANYGLLNAQDLLNRTAVQAETVLEEFVFGTVDRKGQFLSAINAACVGFLEPWRTAGGLFPLYDDNGSEIDPGYSVESGDTVNSAASLAQNKVNVRIALRVSPTGATIEVLITKVGLTSGL